MSSHDVWIIDDCRLSRTFVARAVAPWAVREFACGATALSALAEESAMPLAIFTDEQMPGLRGTVVARAMRDSGYCGTIILLTGTVDEAIRACARDARIDCVVQKPIFRDAVHALLETAERRGHRNSA